MTTKGYIVTYYISVIVHGEGHTIGKLCIRHVVNCACWTYCAYGYILILMHIAPQMCGVD